MSRYTMPRRQQQYRRLRSKSGQAECGQTNAKRQDDLERTEANRHLEEGNNIHCLVRVTALNPSIFSEIAAKMAAPNNPGPSLLVMDLGFRSDHSMHAGPGGP
jgi:hypothetical protein